MLSAETPMNRELQKKLKAESGEVDEKLDLAQNL